MLRSVSDADFDRISTAGSSHWATLGVEAPDPGKVAVLLNRNARQVNDRVIKRIVRLAGRENVFASNTIEEGEAYTREIVQRGYGTILSGGGDGTLAQTFNLVNRYVEEANAWRQDRFARFGERQPLLGMPRFGFLKLGTGNGMSRVVGASSNPYRDVRTIVDFTPARTHRIPLIESEGEQFFFGGMGYDSLILNDYNALSRGQHHPLLKPLTSGIGGYASAVLTKTLPRALFGDTRLEGKVTATGRAYYIDPRRGDAAVELEPDAALFEGRATVIAAGTSPFYGYGLRVFPFSNIMPGMMHLRVSLLGPLQVLANLPSIWRGAYRHPTKMLDFLVDGFHLELDQPFPFQHSGDAKGLRSKLDFKMSGRTLELVDCYGNRVRS